MRNERTNHVSKWVSAAMLAVLCTAGSALAADSTMIHTVELQDGSRSVSILQKFVKVAAGWDLYLIAKGPLTGEKTAAIMRASGGVEFPGGGDQPAWWNQFFAGNGVYATATVEVRVEEKRKLADLVVRGTGVSHLIGSGLFDPNEPWGPCPGPDDAPCRLEPLVIPWICKFDVDQCSGGPLPFPNRVYGLDPDGDPARGITLHHVSLDGTETGNGRTLGITVLPLAGPPRFDYRTKP